MSDGYTVGKHAPLIWRRRSSVCAATDQRLALGLSFVPTHPFESLERFEGGHSPCGNTRKIRHAPRIHTTPTGHGLQVDLRMMCIYHRRATWLGLVTEDLSKLYTWEPEVMYGIAIVLEGQSNKFVRAVGCPPVQTGRLNFKRLWYQRGASSRRIIYLDESAAQITYFTMQQAARYDLWPNNLRRSIRETVNYRKRTPPSSSKARRYPWIPGEEFKNPVIYRPKSQRYITNEDLEPPFRIPRDRVPSS